MSAKNWRELSLIHFSCKCNYSTLLYNKTPTYSAWGLLSVCAAWPSLHLNQSYKLRPPREQHLRYVRHRVHNGYNKYKFPESSITMLKWDHNSSPSANQDGPSHHRLLCRSSSGFVPLDRTSAGLCSEATHATPVPVLMPS